ncbi:hypothetical protein E3Q24_04469 [Wallemia mellicola]|nr:hypothetical protein E3Q24_04469 [Wallemia mellicola]
MKVGKAAGPDNIPVSAIKEFTPIIEPILIKIANSSLRLGHYPKCFKEATCIVIPKPNKKSYREAIRTLGVGKAPVQTMLYYM